MTIKELQEIFQKLLSIFFASFNKKEHIELPKLPINDSIPKEKEQVEVQPAPRVKTPEEIESEDIMLLLKQCRSNPALCDVTKRIRKFINREFVFPNEPNFDRTQLQCTEYVQFRIRQMGISIKWPVKTGRHGGRWASIFKNNDIYKVSDMPKSGCAMSFTAGFKSQEDNNIGHVAFVEEVYPDNIILISEANWDKRGSYQERKLTQGEWKDKWKGKFIYFS